MTPRPYQLVAVENVLEQLQSVSSTLVTMPTGTGKTILFSEVINRLSTGRVLVLAHREELIRQAAAKIESVTGEKPEIEMAAERADLHMFRRAHVVVATVQTLSGSKRLEKFKPRDFGLIITDEAHHSVSPSYQAIYDYFRNGNPDIKHLGVTATPDRTDEEALGQIFKSVAYVYEISDAIKDGWLVPIIMRSVHVDGLDYSGCRTTAGDLNGADVARVMQSESILQQIADATIKLAKWKRTLLFAPPGFSKDKEDPFRVSERLAEIMERKAPGQVRIVTESTPRDTRSQTLRDYSAGKFQFLVNVGVFTEGFDEPGIELIALARATKSRSLYAQMIGRGTRPLPGIVDNVFAYSEFETFMGAEAGGPQKRRDSIAASRKPNIEVLDFEGNCGRHKLVTCADILGGNHPDEVVEAAENKIRESDGAMDVSAAIEAAQREIHRAREIDRLKRKNIVGKATFTTSTVDPFDIFDIEPERERGWHRGRPLSPKMVDTLQGNGIPTADLSYGRASQLIGEIFVRRNRGQCTFKQAKQLAKRGKSTNVTFEEARAMLDAIAAKEGWGNRKEITA